MDRRILPAVPPSTSNASQSQPGHVYLAGQPSTEEDGRAGRPSGGKRRTKKDGDVEAVDDEDGGKKKKLKRRKVDHACVYCRSVYFISITAVAATSVLKTFAYDL